PSEPGFRAAGCRQLGGPGLRIGDQTLPVPRWLETFTGQQVRLGVRAENIQVDSSAPDGDEAIHAEVDVVEPIGSAILLTVRLADQELKVQAPPTFRIEPDSSVWLRFPPDRLHFYDRETAMALEGAR
ncbi:MAG: TOBE domain-containing protein, partial [Stackebrandtia sp.]